MITHIWSVLTSKSVVDSSSNNLSLIDILEKVSIDITPVTEGKGFPKDGSINIPLQYQIVSFFVTTEKNKTEKGKIKIDIISPAGKNFTVLDNTFEIPKNIQRMRVINTIQGIGVTIPGIYTFKISLSQSEKDKYVKVAEIPLDVELHIFNKPKSSTVN